MSTTIDSKVVEMRFDNRQFEQGAQTSISTLEKLKQSLNLTGASKGLENINAAAKKTDLSGVSSGIETISTKFSALQVAGVTALANITNSAVNAGKKIASALTIDPIKTGFSEYETQINAIQTIMSNTRSKGTTLDDVNGALDELNTYADKTIYNFTEMTRNIGTFTAAGVDLETSVSSIKGIANLAAVSGSTSQQASTAMYQLSQALAAGKVQLMDWNSVVNAGMGGQVFQDALKRTATNMGYNVDEMIKKYGSFRESLTKGEWLTSEVLTETLSQLSGAYTEADLIAKGYTKDQAAEIVALAEDAEGAATKVKTFTQLWDTLKESAQSGWTQSWEILVGDFEEARSMLTEVSKVIGDMIGASAKSRNDLLQGWKDAGGRTDLIDGISNAFQGVMNIIGPVKEAFREIFPPLTVDQLVKFTEGFKNLTARFAEFTSGHANEIKSTFKGIFSVIDIGVEFFKQLGGGIVKLIGNLTGLGDSVLSATGSFGDWLSNLRDTVKETDIFGKAVDKITGFIQGIIDKIKSLSGIEIELPGFNSFADTIMSVWEILKSLGSKFVEIGKDIGAAFANVFSFENLDSGLDIMSGGLFAAILLNVKKFVGGLTDAFDSGAGILGNITDILDGVKGCLESFQNSLKAETLKKIAVSVGILAASILVISLINPDRLAASLGAITVLFADLMGSMAIFDKIGGTYDGVTKAVTAMIGISVAVLILASALTKIASLSFGELMTGLVGIVGLTAVVVAVAKALSKDSGTIMKGATSLVIFAYAVKVLASVCKDLSDLSWEELGKGLLGVGTLMTFVALFLNNTKLEGKAFGTAVAMVVMGAAMKVLASACADFGAMKWEEIGKGLASIGALLLEVTAFTKLTGGAGGLISTGVCLVLMGASMKIFASAVKDFASLKWGEIGRGLTAMAGALAAVTIAIRFMPMNMLVVGAGLAVVAGALIVLSTALDRMGSMSWEEIGKGLVVLGGSLVILAAGLTLMSGTLAGSAALLVASVALSIMAPILVTLGNMSWESIAKGLVSIAGALVIFGVAGAVLGPMVGSLLAVSGAFALFGVGLLAAGVGLLAAAAGLTALAGSATAIVAALATIIAGIAGLIPVIIQSLGEALILLAELIVELAPILGKAIVAVILAIVDILVTCVPVLADGLLKLITGVLESLAQYAPQIVESLFQFLINILDSLSAKIPELIQSAVNLLMSFFQGVVDALSGLDTTALIKGIVGVGLMAGLMMALAAVAALTPAAMLGVLGMGAVITQLAIVIAAIGALAQLPGLEWLISEGAGLLQGIGNAIGGFVGGIVGGIAEGITASLPQIATDLSTFMTNLKPFIAGASSIDPSVLDSVKSLAEIILVLTGANLLESLTSWLTGGSSLADFGAQLVPFGEAMKAFSDAVIGIDPATVTAAATAGKILAEMASSLPNSGGLAGFFAGENDMSTFAAQLVPFGKAIKDFSLAVVGLDVAAITNAATAGQALSDLAASLPNSGGLVSLFTGDNDWSSFGTGLVDFGKTLKSYSEAVTGLDSEAIVSSKAAAQALADLADTLPNTGGLAGFFAGENDWNTFGTGLVGFGHTLKSYSDAVAGLSTSAISNSVTAAKKIVELSETLPNSGGVAGFFAGENDWSSFGTGLAGFGKKLKSYSDAVAGISVSAVSNSVSAAKKIVELINSTNNINTSGVGSFKAAVETLGETNVKSFVSAFSGASSKMSSIGGNMVNSITKGLKSKQGSLTVAANGMISSVSKSISGKAGDFTKIGTTLIGNMVKGMSSQTSKVRSAAMSSLTGAVSGIRGHYQSFYSAGSYLVSGFASGISANAYKAAAKARAMAKAAEKAAKDELDINSPSKVFRSIGYSVPEGFAMGIDRLSGMVRRSSTNMADDAVKSVGKSISRIAAAVNTDVDTQPTIRPVVDLSDVESKAHAIDGMFGMTPSVGLLSNVGTISSMMNQNGQNGNSDVVSAIDKLRKDLGNVGGTTYNVNGVTYDDGSNISNTVEALVRAVRIERRV